MTSASPGFGPAPDAGDTADAEVIILGAGRRSRDEQFTAFVTEHQADLLRTAWLLCGDGHRAEELTQQALVRTYVAWARVAAGDPSAYARRVLANLRTDTWRRRRHEVLVPPENLPDRAVQPGTASSRDTADDQADHDELVRALATLSSRQRRIVVLRYFVGLPEADVATDLGVSVGTVKSTASRALAQLRASLCDPSQPSVRSPR
jgi:RNA polymerase sigma-70 factor (sigma-E family)